MSASLRVLVACQGSHHGVAYGAGGAGEVLFARVLIGSVDGASLVLEEVNVRREATRPCAPIRPQCSIGKALRARPTGPSVDVAVIHGSILEAATSGTATL